MRTSIKSIALSTALTALFATGAFSQETATIKKTQKLPSAAAQAASTQEPTQPAPAAAAASQPVAAVEAPAKKNVVRIGIIMPKAQLGKGNAAVDAAVPVRDTLVSYLKGPSFEIVPIEARLASQIDAEAREKQFDFVLASSVTQKQGGSGGFGSLLKSVAPMAGMMIPGAGLVGMVAGEAVGTAATMASAVKAKDEVTLEFKLYAPGSEAAPKVASSIKAKAKSDGEDVLTSLIEQAANAIVTELSKK
jgi:hypothetical protein